MAQKSDARLVDLRCIHVDVLAAARRSDAEIIHEPATYLEKDFHAVDQEKHDDDEQENGIATVEDAVQSVFVGEEFR